MRGSGGKSISLLSLPNGGAIMVLGRRDYNHSVSDEQLVAHSQATLNLLQLTGPELFVDPSARLRPPFTEATVA
jgi:hypothetical protein